MISTIVSRLVILVFGTLYPAYASYKAVRTKNVKEYVKWMMYWIVFALFTCAETFTDVFLSWFPFYYEIKIILVLWLLSPATKGSSILYRKFVHPMLSRREQEIDEYLAKAKEQGYHTVLNLGTKGVNYATTVIMQTAIKGGGGIVNQLRKSYSLSDLTDDTDSRSDVRALQHPLSDEQSDIVDPRHVRRRHSPRRSASGSSRVDMYFPEVDIRPGPALGHVRSTEDVSSGYSSAEPLYVGQPPKLEPREALGLVRTASVGGASKPRTRTTRQSLGTKKTTTLPEDSEESESDSEITVIQQVYKTFQIQRTSIIDEHEDSELSENSNEFVDTIGFPLTPVKIQTTEETQKIFEVKSKIPEPVQEISMIKEMIEPEIIQNVEIANQEISVLEEIIEPEIIQNVEIAHQEISVIKEIIEPEIIQNVEISNQEISVLKEIIEPENIQITQNVEITEPVPKIEALIEIKIEKEPSIDVFEDTVETNENERFDSQPEINNVPDTLTTEITENKIVLEENVPVESIKSTSSDIDSISLTSNTQRGGKYNKHVAPTPPTVPALENHENIPEPNESKPEKLEPTPEIAPILETSNKNTSEPEKLESVIPKPEISKELSAKLDDEKSRLEISIETPEKSSPLHVKSEIPEPVSDLSESSPRDVETHSIKATLVLKPGIIKNIGPKTEESSKTEIFLSQTPKAKLKTKSKHDSPISRLMMLPKKIFGSKESSNESLKDKDKRKSWQPDSRSLTPSSVEDLKSKSDTEDNYETIEYLGDDRKAVSAVEIDKRHQENKMILRTLSHSPKQYRRKNKKDDYDYEDSD